MDSVDDREEDGAFVGRPLQHWPGVVIDVLSMNTPETLARCKFPNLRLKRYEFDAEDTYLTWTFLCSAFNCLFGR